MNLFKKLNPKRKLITFGALSPDYFETPSVHPIPLSKFDHSWYKNIKIDKHNEFYFNARNNSKTIKHCPSFVEVLQNGFVIPSPADYFIHCTEEGHLIWHTPFSFANYTGLDDVVFHDDKQMVDHLPTYSDIKAIVKINLPLKIFTPSGYSVAFMRMPFGDHRDFEAVYGNLRADRNHNLNIQLAAKHKDQFVIKQGTPLCIVVPFKREKFDSQVIDLNEKSKFRKIWLRHYLKTYGSENSKFRQDYWKE